MAMLGMTGSGAAGKVRLGVVRQVVSGIGLAGKVRLGLALSGVFCLG